MPQRIHVRFFGYLTADFWTSDLRKIARADHLVIAGLSEDYYDLSVFEATINLP